MPDFYEKNYNKHDWDMLDYIKSIGYTPRSTLNYSSIPSGIDYFIGDKGDKAIVVAFITDENNYMITKDDTREMAETARNMGINHVELHTNYGIELHSKHEKPSDIGFDKISKVYKSFANGGKVDDRIAAMIANWENEGRAFSLLQYNDGAFFDAIGVPYEEIGTTSNYGSDIVYYDTSMYNSGSDAIKGIKRYAKGGELDEYMKSAQDDLSGPEKLQMLGISYTNEFGNKYRAWLNKMNKLNENGDYVGYQLSTNQNHIKIIGSKGTVDFVIKDYHDFPKHAEAYRASMVHYSLGGEIKGIFTSIKNWWNKPI